MKFKSYNYLSEADLRLLEGWSDDLPFSDPKLFKEILFKHGAEVSQPIELTEDTHRLRTSNKVHTGKRWVFQERLDKEWLRSGCATIEAYMASSDPEIQRDIDNMRRYAKLPQSKDTGELDE